MTWLKSTGTLTEKHVSLEGTKVLSGGGKSRNTPTIMVQKGVILLWVKYFEKGSRRITMEIVLSNLSFYT